MKLRAWDDENKKMIYSNQLDGHIITADKDGNISISRKEVDNNFSQSMYILTLLNTMQSTGYVDTTGVEIYDGDIVQFDDLGEEGYEYREAYDIINQAIVAFNNGRWEFDIFAEVDTRVVNEMNGDVSQEEWHEFMSKCLKVIGNIFENRDLLLKWVCDEKATEEQWDDMRRDGKEVDKSIQIGMWEDYNIN
jgi:yopX protein|nr:MAG TPA: YopX protein [Caudoviricetes sp.]